MAARAEFESSLSYALSCLKLGDITLKDKQKESIQCLYEGKDVFLWLPTGYGKSVCFHCLPFLFDYKFGRVELPPCEKSVCLVVSPLISLMVDQVESLRGRGVSAAILSGNKGIAGTLLASDVGIKRGMYRLLFTAPEAVISSEKWRHILVEEPLCNQVVAVAIDEAHCVSKW